jgi:plastocyanin
MKDHRMKLASLLFTLALVNMFITPATAAAAGANQITVKNFMFSPMTLTVTRGTTVTWKNLDGEPHLVVSLDGKFRSPALDQNDSFSFRFDKPGTYKYICTIHPQMKGAITVK